MHSGASDSNATPRVLVWSGRKLLVDCLSHHFTTTVPNFHVVSGLPEELDPSVPTVCIRDVGRHHYGVPDKRRVLAEIRQGAPSARILIFSGQPADDDACEWIVAGAHGYFPTLSPPSLLTAAVTLVAAGGIYLPEELARSLLSSAQGRRDDG